MKLSNTLVFGFFTHGIVGMVYLGVIWMIFRYLRYHPEEGV